MASLKELQKVMPLYHNMKIPLILHTRILIFKLVFYFNILHVNITKSKKNSISKLYMKWYYGQMNMTVMISVENCNFIN